MLRELLYCFIAAIFDINILRPTNTNKTAHSLLLAFASDKHFIFSVKYFANILVLTWILRSFAGDAGPACHGGAC